jgi:hypothetical protein
MASEALGLLPGGMPEMQEHFLSAMDGGHAENAGSNSRPAHVWMAGLSRPSMASEALGFLPGGMPEMQEHFPAPGRSICAAAPAHGRIRSFPPVQDRQPGSNR